MADEQDVFITGVGGSVAAWSTEATQKQIEGSLKQIQADGNAMIRFLHHIANGTKVSENELKKAVNEIKISTGLDKTSDKKELTQGTRIINTQTKLHGTGLATLSALSGLRDSQLDAEHNQRKRDGIRDALLSKGFSESDADKGADRAMKFDLFKRLSAKVAKLGTVAKGVVDLISGAVDQGFTERFAMVAEMRQAGLLSATKNAEDGFISMSKTISATNFTFGEATEFTKRFSQAVGVNGVKSALSFANTVASGTVENGMDYMRKYALEFGQVSNIAGEYLDSLRIGGQLRGMDDRSMRAGMDDFMSNVEMTSNVLKISMEDAADLMKKALGPESVALLATLPEEQRKAIDAGFKSVNAQGNPMSETLAKRLAAGSQGAFLQTAEFQDMNQTAPGREVLKFVEQMAQQLENGDTQSFQAALAEGFPALADRLTQMATQGGVRVQLLSDPQLASMVGQIISAAQTYGDAAKGTRQGTKSDEDQAMMSNLIQLREASVLNESAINNHMKTFTKILEDLVKVHRDIARSTALMMEDYTGTVHAATTLSKWWEEAKGWGLTGLMDFATSEDLSKHPDPGVLSLLKTQGQPGYGDTIDQKELTAMDQQIDASTERIIADYNEMKGKQLSEAEQLARAKNYKGELEELAFQIAQFAGAARTAGILGKDGNYKKWEANLDVTTKQIALISELINKL